LAAALAREGIAVLFLTTMLFSQMARKQGGGAARAAVRWEAADAGAVRALRATGRRLINVSGLTESTTFATYEIGEVAAGG
jgi:hypothetical protein